MDFEFFLDKVYDFWSLFWWIPVLIWPAYFFLCRFLDYPSVLEEHIRNGKVWPYLPIYWKGKKKRMVRTASILLFCLGSLSFACALYYLFPYRHLAFLLLGFGLSIFIEIKIRFYGTIEIIRLQQERYFQIYTHLANQALAKGDEISDSQLLAKTQWQQQNDLRLADKQGRLLQFLRGEAKL